ncbi:hypothetical protein CUZ56_01687 [Saezia sanguinis]|uniref:Uncharacterized protein n=1 Tax=Saezia sanguinis TaxID=1965230 RepID=A0A433SDT6_9BURK|nr:hypothetical protein [Saezia sanguinis]RUS66892.1 hypothetical protein CUZ56_01687 [Saezia sanguinis]
MVTINEKNVESQIESEAWEIRNSKKKVLAYLFLAQLFTFFGPFMVFPWFMAGIPSCLTAWLFYWYVDHCKSGWSVMICTAISGETIQYAYSIFLPSDMRDYRFELICIAAVCGGVISLVMLRGFTWIVPERRQLLQEHKWLNIANFAFAGILFGGWMFLMLSGNPNILLGAVVAVGIVVASIVIGVLIGDLVSKVAGVVVGVIVGLVTVGCLIHILMSAI